MKKVHEPVMLPEVIQALHIKTDGKYVDGTLGNAGHTLAILEHGGKVIGIDADRSMLEIAEENISESGFKDKFKAVNDNFRNIKQILKAEDFYPVDGILLDLGISSKHLDDDERGFSFKNPESALDMRLDTDKQSVTASSLLNALREDQLLDLFEKGMKYGEARKWASLVVKRRSEKPFSKVSDLLEIAPPKFDKNNPATKAFMALRIAVNSEYDNLVQAMEDSLGCLNKNGRLVIITFHSGEDRIVKEFMKRKESEEVAELPGNQPIKPSEDEVQRNARARSAKVRILIKK